ncbi:UNVERIFIED_CONTAM: hypothetical protein GTU68_033010 [Idotea baltica]|nr:hypothetical protein [Idotea baltica]
MGFEEATPIQEQSIPIIMNGEDIIACAQTGTGKTAAFILPTLHKLFTNPKKEVTRALVICPTRELAIQIDKQIQGFTYFLGLHSIAIYGGGSGNDWVQEKEALSQGADIIVSTPGKLISHLNMGYVDFSQGVSSDYEQKEREAVIANFKSLRTRIVVATDVLSRGIDIKDINLVINYDTPSNAEDYVHRVGRTARADTTGVAITFVNEDDMKDFHEIEQLIDMEIMKLPPFPELGAGPTWNPNARKKKKSYGGKNKKYGGKKNWKKKR